MGRGAKPLMGAASIERLDLDVPEPNRRLSFSMQSLESDRAGSRIILQRDGEFVRRAVGVFSRRVPVIQIDVYDLLAIEDHGYAAVATGDGVVIPFSHWFRRVGRGRLGIVDCAD